MNNEEIIAKILNNEVRLDQECWGCKHDVNKIDGVCFICNGVGFVPTDLGQAILDLIARHMKGAK